MKKIEPNETLSDKAYKAVKRAIVHGKFADNERLPEAKLAEMLGVSRTPLREALGRLADEGLIIQKRGAPARVSTFSKEKALEYMELRTLLEVYNIEKVTTVLSDQIIDQLKENVAKQEMALDVNNYEEFLDLDREFHLILASVNPNRELEHFIYRLNTGTSRAFLILSKTLPQSAVDAYNEHVDIIQALETRDILLARKQMFTHLNNIIERFLLYIEQ